MRILFILHQFYPEFAGGTERVALNLARCAQRAGHYIRVLACTVDPLASPGRPSAEVPGALEIVYRGVPITLLLRASLPATADIDFVPAPSVAASLEAWIKRQKFEIAHVLHSMRMGSALLAVQRCGLPYVVTLTDFFSSCFRINLINLRQELCPGPEEGRRCAEDCLVPPWTRDSLADRYRYAQDLLGTAGARVCPSDYVAQRYRKAFPPLRFTVIPHGIDLSVLVAADPAMARHDAGEVDLILGFIGAITPHKGLHVLLQALARIPRARIKLRVAGGFYGDPTYNSEVERLAAADSRVELLGQVLPDQVFAIIRTLDVLCLPSNVAETFSLILHEAEAAGIPALVSDLGAPGQRVSQDGGGRVLPIDDVEAWARAIAELAEHPEPLSTWRSKLTLPLRVEEEAFLYESLYRNLLRPSVSEDP